MVKFKTLRKSHALAGPVHKHSKRGPTCNSPSLYKSPSNGDTVQATDPFTVNWDTSYASCLDAGTTNIDIYLLSPTAQSGHVKVFSSVPFTAGSYTQKKLDSNWWNNTGDVELTINFAPTGQVLALSPFAAGPVINVKSQAGAAPSGDVSDSSLKTSGDVAHGGGLPKGSVAAAILLPILAIIAALAIYIKISRKKRAEKLRRFSHAMNARMSRLSGDWQQESGKLGPRASTASGLRMSQVINNDGVQMDVRDSMARASIANYPYGQSQPVGSRTSRFNPPSIGTRQSRISFAPDTNASKERLSTYSTGRGSRAFMAEEIPPVPRPEYGRQSMANPISFAASAYDVNSIYAVESHEQHEEAHAILSPTQTNGPVALSNDDINNIDIAPALSLMRNGGNPAAKSSEELLFTTPAPPAPTLALGTPQGASFNVPPLSPVGAMPMQSQPTTSMSPDDMLRQYAKAKSRNPLGTSISTPNIAYAPTTPTSPLYTATGMKNLTGAPN